MQPSESLRSPSKVAPHSGHSLKGVPLKWGLRFFLPFCTAPMPVRSSFVPQSGQFLIFFLLLRYGAVKELHIKILLYSIVIIIALQDNYGGCQSSVVSRLLLKYFYVKAPLRCIAERPMVLNELLLFLFISTFLFVLVFARAVALALLGLSSKSLGAEGASLCLAHSALG